MVWIVHVQDCLGPVYKGVTHSNGIVWWNLSGWNVSEWCTENGYIYYNTISRKCVTPFFADKLDLIHCIDCYPGNCSITRVV